jgi:PHD/YefM family antitoxin component YafN of YafNO toxin-antitoxin module
LYKYKGFAVMNWTIGEARKRFAELVQAASQEPQPIYRRDKLAAVLVDAEQYGEFEQWQKTHQGKSIAEAFVEYRTIAKADDYQLEIPKRRNRPVKWQ